MFTDGIVEACDLDKKGVGSTYFFTMISEEVDNGLFVKPMEDVLDALYESVLHHRGAHPFDDDITLIGARVK